VAAERQVGAMNTIATVKTNEAAIRRAPPELVTLRGVD
jgi:hypothetical protein